MPSWILEPGCCAACHYARCWWLARAVYFCALAALCWWRAITAIPGAEASRDTNEVAHLGAHLTLRACDALEDIMQDVLIMQSILEGIEGALKQSLVSRTS